MKQLLLFTEFFPYGANSEQAFIQNEIKYLCEKFDKVTVFPSVVNESQSSFGNFNIDKTLSVAIKKKSNLHYIFLALKNKFFYKELVSRKFNFWNYAKLKRLLYYTANAQSVSQWFNVYLKNHNSINKTIVYTYWNNEITLGLASTIINKSNFLPISRAHGHDIYENYYINNYLPCYNNNLKLIHKLYLVSEPPIKHILNNYVVNPQKLKKIYLGVKKAEKINKASTDGIIRIVSCSYIIPPKRVDLILKGILKYIEMTDQKVVWTHFGSDRDLGIEGVQKVLQTIKTDKLNYNLKGFCFNKEIIKFYETEPVDLFITATKVEGGVPVSLQEAQAHGIPVIGTDVGGIPEIINDNVGVLIRENPVELEIANAIINIVSDKTRHEKLRANSLTNWEKNFNEEVNFNLFATEIYNLF
jgi:colanic acid/amylovoran biosynthesis glycosyltransferase